MVRHARRAVSLAVVIALAHSVPLGAYEREVESTWDAPQVSSGNWRVDAILSIGGVLQVDGQQAGQGRSRDSAGESACEWNVVVLPALEEIHLWETAPSEGAIPVQIRCGAAIVSERWVGVADIRDVDAEARAGAQRYVESVLAPRLELGSSPPDNVLVGLDTWFWLDGWDGEPIRTTVTAPWGDSIELELSLIEVEWRFGDGGPPLRGGLGEAHPEESSIAHLYERRSTSRIAPDGAFDLSATIRIAVRYWYDGDGPFSVAPLETTHTAPVVVRQLQSVLG
jgi:hypothetical protein